jgi:hypothetical protein
MGFNDDRYLTTSTDARLEDRNKYKNREMPVRFIAEKNESRDRPQPYGAKIRERGVETQTQKSVDIANLISGFSSFNLLNHFKAECEYAIQDIMAASKLSYKPVYLTLMSLARDGYLLRRRIGWKHFFRLNTSNPFVRKNMEMVEVRRREAFLGSIGIASKEVVERVIRILDEMVAVLGVIALDKNPGSPANGSVGLLFIVHEKKECENLIKQVCSEAEMSVAVASSFALRKIFENGGELCSLIKRSVILHGFEFIMGEAMKHTLTQSNKYLKHLPSINGETS